MASFKNAFASARKGGKKTFSWNGKSYNTKLKGESVAAKQVYKSTPQKAPTPTARPNPVGRSSGSGGPLVNSMGGSKTRGGARAVHSAFGDWKRAVFGGKQAKYTRYK